MKPYNKEFLLQQMQKYNNLINTRTCGNYRIVKNILPKEKLCGYMYENKEEYNIEIIELLEGNVSLMKLDPREIQSDYGAIKFAHGKVGVVGLGLGYSVQEMAKKDEVKEITVYEMSSEVIKLYINNFGENNKIKIIQQDAFKAQKQRFDFFFVDIYEYTLTTKIAEDYKKLNEVHHIEEYSFWGMEHFLLSCRYEELVWVYIPENWFSMCKNIYEKLQVSGYINQYKQLDEKIVEKTLLKFKEVLNEDM